MARLRILAGVGSSSTSSKNNEDGLHLEDVTRKVNTGTPHTLRSDVFEGEVVMHIKGFPSSPSSVGNADGYFESEERRGVSWSIQVRGETTVVQKC